ncbi:MAG: TrmJ/YjtD family RNA methyltransferase [Methanobacteriaceae archaeon]|nr:TrmJ/YjtD family RNA methyltransferase [Methanobacteriaceae archaeon]
MIYIVFVEPESPGNIGFLARTMKNFGLDNLILINPCELKNEAYFHAMHAKEVISNARLFESIESFIEEFKIDFMVGTTGAACGSYNVQRIAITPEEFAGSLQIKGNIAILFGREGNGLYNEEISLCDVLVSIPTSDKYPILNISHAAAIIFYELFKKEKNYTFEGLEEASAIEKGQLISDMDNIIELLNLPPHKNKTASIVFRNIIGRAFISGREAHTLKGILRRVKERI